MSSARYIDYIGPIHKLATEAIGDHPPSRANLLIADQSISLVSNSNSLTTVLLPAIEHLSCETPASKPDFTIHLVDLSQTKHKRLPLIPWEPLLRRGHRGIQVDGLYIQFVHIKQTDVMILSLYDSRTNKAYYIVSNTKKLPWYIRGAPLHEILYWWTRSNDMHILHCGVVGNEFDGIALLGAKGAGKSTMVLTAIENGFNYVSEDYCIVRNSDTPIAYSLYNSAKFTNYTYSRFPHLSKFKKNNNTDNNEKHLVYYTEIHPDKLRNKLAIKALVSLSLQTHAPTTLVRSNMERAYLDMISSTTLQNPVYELTSTNFFQCLKSKIDSYELAYGSDTHTSLNLLSKLIQ